VKPIIHALLEIVCIVGIGLAMCVAIVVLAPAMLCGVVGWVVWQLFTLPMRVLR
jgi:hypothetical protein